MTKRLTFAIPPRRRLVEDNMGAAPMALGIMMGIPTQPFRAISANLFGMFFFKTPTKSSS
jgi:hypothetical protein